MSHFQEVPEIRALLARASLVWFFVCPLQAARPPAPTEIVLSSNLLVENAAPTTLIGVLTAEDPDPEDSHIFALVDGIGSNDNYRFSINGNELAVPEAWEGPWGVTLDFESQPTFSIRVRTTDSTGLIYEKVFAIQLSDDRAEDDDGDGLDEAVEEDVHATSDLLHDSDGDGFSDSIEVSENSSPTDVDDWPDYPLVIWGDNRPGGPMPPVDAGFLAVSIGQQHTLGLRFDASVATWGELNMYAHSSAPAGLDQVVAIAAGGDLWQADSSHSLALKSDGTVVAWGYNDGGWLTVPEGLAGVVGIAAGGLHCLALKGDGTVVVWGRYLHVENPVPSGLADVVAIADGGFHSLALKSDGTVVAWGETFNGQSWENVTVPAGLCDVVGISAGRFHSLALKSDGTVVAWGYDHAGQATVPAGLEQVVAIAAGGFHSLALKQDGSVVGWGYNSDGQAMIPAAAAAEGQISAISAGLLHSFALRKTASSPAISSSSTLVSAPGLPISHQLTVANAVASRFSAIGLPDGLTLDPLSGLIEGSVTGAARRSIQILVDTDQGRLSQGLWLNVFNGLPPSGISLSPAAVMENSPTGTVVGTLTSADPDLEDSHIYELVSGGGSTDNGSFVIAGDQLIVNGTIQRDFEANPANFSIRVRARDASLNLYEEVIALPVLDDRQEDADQDMLTEAEEEDVHDTSDLTYDTDGDGFGDGYERDRGTSPSDAGDFPSGQILVAWGSDDKGQATIPSALRDVAALGGVAGLAAGGSHNLVLKSDGTVAAWGWNLDGQCEVPAGLGNVVGIGAGGTHSVALIDDGTVVAWGNNEFGQCNVPQNLSGVVAIAAGKHHNLALTGDGLVVAWGNNEYAQSTVPEGLSGVVAVAVGASHSLALKSDGSVVAWGAPWGWPVSGVERITGLAAGGWQSLALRSDGTVAAWSDHQPGQPDVPQDLDNVVDLKWGWEHGIVLRRDGTVVAWGSNADGQSTVPFEASNNVQALAAGSYHNLALRQVAEFPQIEPATVVGWPGQQVSHQLVVSGATPVLFSAIGLPADLALDPLTGLISGMVETGERRAVRVSVATATGRRLSRILWINTVDGVPPTGIVLAPVLEIEGHATMQENCPEGTVVATLIAVDPDVGDVHTFDAYVFNGGDRQCMMHIGNQLVVGPRGLDFESSGGWLYIRVRAVDSALNFRDQEFAVRVTDDRTEDADGDGVDEAKEEDFFLASDLEYDDFTTADPDNDGVPSIVEYAFNLDLQAADSGHYLGTGGSTSGLPLIYPIMDGEGEPHLRIEYLRRIGSGLVYRPEFASGLNPDDWAPGTQAVEITPVDLEWERCMIDDDPPLPRPAVRFGRISISQ